MLMTVQHIWHHLVTACLVCPEYCAAFTLACACGLTKAVGDTDETGEGITHALIAAQVV